MNWFDLILILFSGFFLWRGFHIGFIQTSLFYISLCSGTLGAFFFKPQMNLKWAEWGIEISQTIIGVVSWIVLFLVIALCAQLISLGIRIILKPILSSPIDRLLGLILGVVKSIVFILVLCWIISLFPKKYQSYLPLKESIVYQHTKSYFFLGGKIEQLYKKSRFETLIPKIEKNPISDIIDFPEKQEEPGSSTWKFNQE